MIYQAVSKTTEVATNYRVVQFERFKGDTQTAKQAAPFGIDSNPIADMIAIHAETSAKDGDVILGYLNRSHVAEPGETRFFSLDSNGAVKAFGIAKADGTLHLNGDSDFGVLFNALKTEFNELKGTVNDHIADYNSHIHTTTATIGATATPGVISPTTSTSTPSTADIDNAKNSRIKTNS